MEAEALMAGDPQNALVLGIEAFKLRLVYRVSCDFAQKFVECLFANISRTIDL